MPYRSWLVCVVACLLARPAHAETQDFAITLNYRPNRLAVVCPSEAFVRGEVARRLGYDLFVPAAPLHLSISVVFVHDKYRLTGLLTDDIGTIILDEVFEDAICETVVMAEVNSIVAELIRFPEACPACPTCPSAPVASKPAPAPAPAPRAAPAQPLPPPVVDQPLLQLGLASVFSIGAAPVVVGGVSGGVGVRWSNISAEIEIKGLFAPSATIKDYHIHDGYRYFVAQADALGCYHAGWAFGCVQGNARILSIRNSNPQIDKIAPTVDTVGAGVRVGGEWPLTSLVSLRAYGEVSLQLVLGTLHENTNNVLLWSGPIAAGSFGFGPVFKFSTL